MKNLAIKPVSMTSLEIANLTEVRHDNVKRTIERLIEQGVIAQPQSEDVQNKGGNNRKYTTLSYRFTGDIGKRDCLVLLTQLSSQFAGKVVDRWLELESKETDRQNQALSRRSAADLYINQSGTIHDRNLEEGKPDKPYHFSNEADMINRIIFGMSSKKYREHHEFEKTTNLRDVLLKEELDAISDLQSINISLIKIGMSFQERKKALNDRFIKKHNDGLVLLYSQNFGI